MPLVDVLRDDEVHLAVLVLEQHEHDPLRGRRPLPRDREAGEGDRRAVRRLVQLGARERPPRAGAAGAASADGPDGEARLPVVGEHPLPAREVGERGGLGGRVERERELLRLAPRALDRPRPGREPELPEEVAARGPKPSQAPPRTSASSASRETVPAGRGRRRPGTARSRSRSASSASASSFPTDETYASPTRTACDDAL